MRVWQEGKPHYGVAWTEKPEHLLNLDALGGGGYYWSVAVIRGRDGKMGDGDGTIPTCSAVLEGAEIHPVHQNHGALYVDEDVRVRLRYELIERV